MANLLNSRKEQLNARLPNYDESYTIRPTEFTIYNPIFPRIPTLDEPNYFYATFKGSLNNYGFIYVICVIKDKDKGQPSPFQIWKGFDSVNVPVAHGYGEVSKPYADILVNVTNLEPLTEYNAYVIGGSAHPGYPDLGAEKYVVQIRFTTAPSPKGKFWNLCNFKAERLNINHEGTLKSGYTLLLVVITVLFALM
jgi:hypothetical protein